jgi:hypothetical protein
MSSLEYTESSFGITKEEIKEYQGTFSSLVEDVEYWLEDKVTGRKLDSLKGLWELYHTEKKERENAVRYVVLTDILVYAGNVYQEGTIFEVTPNDAGDGGYTCRILPGNCEPGDESPEWDYLESYDRVFVPATKAEEAEDWEDAVEISGEITGDEGDY